MPKISQKIQDRVAQIESLTLRVEEAAKLMGVSPSHLMRLADAGKAPRPIRLGAAVRFRKSQILEFLAQ